VYFFVPLIFVLVRQEAENLNTKHHEMARKLADTTALLLDAHADSKCVAVCCSVLQCVAVCCRVLQCVAVRCSALQCIAVHCRALQFVAVRCSAF